MSGWAKPGYERDQAVLFYPTLDRVIPEDHPVRFFDEVLRRLDGSAWEAEYDRVEGQPPIHPRVVASAILYGLSMGIRSSRRLEWACGDALDYLWLVEGGDGQADEERGGETGVCPAAVDSGDPVCGAERDYGVETVSVAWVREGASGVSMGVHGVQPDEDGPDSREEAASGDGMRTGVEAVLMEHGMGAVRERGMRHRRVSCVTRAGEEQPGTECKAGA